MTMPPDAEVARFVAAARAYCAFVRDADAYDEVARVRTAARLLATLYGLGLLLPSSAGAVDEDDDDGSEPAVETPSFAFDDHEFYYVVGRPFDLTASEITCGALSDDVTDVFLDIATGLAWLDQGAPERAVWYWKLMFPHWGKHVVDALTALQQAIDELSYTGSRADEEE